MAKTACKVVGLLFSLLLLAIGVAVLLAFPGVFGSTAANTSPAVQSASLPSIMAKTACKVVGLLFSLLLLAIGVAVLLAFPGVYHLLIKRNVVLAYKKTGFDSWVNPPFPIYFKVWMWNLTNADDVLKGAKPNVTQVGPYTYRETKNKENVTFLSSDEEISYTTLSQYEFVSDMSVENANPMIDKITSINIPYLTVVNMVSFWGDKEKSEIKLAALLTGSHVFESHTVDELLWGYEDPLLKLIALQKPGLVPSTVFGLFAGKNNSDDGVYVVDSGKTDPSRTSSIKTYKGNSSLTFWTTNTTNMINGTDGTYYHPFIDKKEPLYVFSSDICRSIQASYEKPIDVEGLIADRFVGTPEDFQNTTLNPANLGFCTPNASYCLPGGLLNVSNCHQDAPVVMSLPHFLFAEEKVLEMLDGNINPIKEKHQTSFDLEPITGGPLQVFKRLQINIHQKAYKDMPAFQNLPNAYLPILWLEESSVVTPEYAKQLEWMTLKIWVVVHISQWLFIGLGILLSIIMVSCLLSGTRNSSDLARPVNTPSENSPLLGNKA